MVQQIRDIVWPVLSIMAVLMLHNSPALGRPVVMNITYVANNSPFDASTYFTTNDGLQELLITRLEFYLSAVRLVGTDGTEEILYESVVLANALNDKSHFIGNSEMTDVASVKFGVGVPPIYNHLDPSTYPPGHPLGNQEPSMHWGWTAGYRFVAIEGLARQSGGNSQHFEVHTVDDSLYRNTQTPVFVSYKADTLVLTITADVGRILEGITAYTGLINHSAEAEAITVMNNMASVVFPKPTSSVQDIVNNQPVSIYPNPASEYLTVESVSTATVHISDITGAEVLAKPLNAGINTIDVSNVTPGMYILHVVNAMGPMTIQPIVIQP